jgi:hypothetical protein
MSKSLLGVFLCLRFWSVSGQAKERKGLISTQKVFLLIAKSEGERALMIGIGYGN